MFEAAEVRAKVLREQDIVNYMLEDEAFYEEEKEELKQEMDPALHNEEEFDGGMSPSDREAVMLDDGENDEQGHGN